MYEIYRAYTSEGSAAEIWIDREAGLCKKYYKPDGITISGSRTQYKNIEKLYEFYITEVKWSLALQSEWVAELYEHGEENGGYYIIQEYSGNDLMVDQVNGQLHTKYPDIVQQTIEMFEFFSKHRVYKFNNSLSNMTAKNGKIKAFDFKYAKTRKPEYRHAEINSINKWLSKIDSSILEKLEKYI